MVEIGAGTGLCGLVAAACGARAVLTDLAGSAALRNLRATAALNARKGHVRARDVTVAPLNWGRFSPATLALAEQCDIVKAANGSKPIDASKLGEMGVATSADAIAGIDLTSIIGKKEEPRRRRAPTPAAPKEETRTLRIIRGTTIEDKEIGTP